MINSINSNTTTNTYIDTMKRTMDKNNISFERLLEKEEKGNSYNNHKKNISGKTYSGTNSYDASKTYTRNGAETNPDNKSNDVETKTDIIVKSDGSRVLVITTKIGEMESTMSLEISKPTNILNAENNSDEKNNVLKSDEDTSSISNEDGEIAINEMLH